METRTPSPVTPALRKKFIAAWMPKAMASLRRAVELGIPEEECLNYEHMMFKIGLYETKTTTPKRR